MTQHQAARTHAMKRLRILAAVGLLLSVVLMIWGIGDSIRGRPGGSLMIVLGAAEFVLIGLLVPLAIRRGRL